ncbi:hypothetical protein LMG31884_46770 (plasmid) [Xanthomonas hydrangeae]|uniref:hypothetical protein n=1 Tax=Xanthomonas hydrangeae TaxID=2775159 RepID=UPI001AFB9CEC|nr:hypothetical protein LMG31884_46770 [Xanthomonas hydrangeae]CAD7740525.1 hypothetical protein LMG31884_46770 [Xanthomonas hydrangeae]
MINLFEALSTALSLWPTPSLAMFASGSATPISDALAKAAPFLVTDGEVSTSRYMVLLMACLTCVLIPVIVMSKLTGQGNRGALRNVGICLLGTVFALTPFTLPIGFGFMGYALWRSAFPATTTS